MYNKVTSYLYNLHTKYTCLNTSDFKNTPVPKFKDVYVWPLNDF